MTFNNPSDKPKQENTSQYDNVFNEIVKRLGGKVSQKQEQEIV